jgi:peptidoglycan-N-acetylglucosamine deacetylase
MADSRPLGTLQVDVDELWVYYESIGRQTPDDAPPVVYQQGIPRLLDLFDRFGIRATFFVCGRDLPAQAGVLLKLIQRGHEVANHSNTHRNGFARLSPGEKRADVAAAGERIADATGCRPAGFKSPGFSFSTDLLEVLIGLGYLYDSSLLPTPYAALLRGLQRALSHGEVDPTHYGRAEHGLAPLRPYRPDLARPYRPARHLERKSAPGARPAPAIWEAPVTTMPVLRLPLHSTFVLSAGRWLFDAGMAMVKARGVPVNYLLHAADVVDAVPDPVLASYRFLNQSWDAKRPLYEHLLGSLSSAYRLVPTCEFVSACA